MDGDYHTSYWRFLKLALISSALEKQSCVLYLLSDQQMVFLCHCYCYSTDQEIYVKGTVLPPRWLIIQILAANVESFRSWYWDRVWDAKLEELLGRKGSGSRIQSREKDKCHANNTKALANLAEILRILSNSIILNWALCHCSAWLQDMVVSGKWWLGMRQFCSWRDPRGSDSWQLPAVWAPHSQMLGAFLRENQDRAVKYNLIFILPV